MMKKAGVGMLRSIIGICLIGGAWIYGATAVLAEETPPVDIVSEDVAEISQVFYQERLADLRTADIKKLRRELKEVELNLDSADVATTSAAVQAARDYARTHSTEVKNIETRMEELHKEFDQAIDRDPAVVAAKVEADRAHTKLMDTLNLRTGLLQLIASKERLAEQKTIEAAAQEKAR